jgi:hypothetical protein
MEWNLMISRGEGSRHAIMTVTMAIAYFKPSLAFFASSSFQPTYSIHFLNHKRSTQIEQLPSPFSLQLSIPHQIRNQ